MEIWKSGKKKKHCTEGTGRLVSGLNPQRSKLKFSLFQMAKTWVKTMKSNLFIF